MENNTAGKEIKVFIIDKQILFGEGLVSLLRKEREINIVGLSTDLESAYLKIKIDKPDIVLTDFSFIKEGEIDKLSEFIGQNKDIKFIALNTSCKEQDVIYAFRNGAVAFIRKQDSKDKLLKIIYSTFKEGHSIPRSYSPYILNELRERKSYKKLFSLTKREREILTLLCEGLINKEIAKELKIKEKTVRNILSNIYSKFGINSRSEAILKAIKTGLVP